MLEPGEAARFQNALLAWHRCHGRHDLPWQRPATPYRVWVSEVMLQQTRVGVVIPYFERFMARFPDVETLAGAPLDDVLALWSGLGYYARARNLHRAARIIVDEHGGELPGQIDALEALPGIGRSTAGAILSLAGGQRQPILDGNVKRVVARYAAVEGWPGSSPVQRTLWAWSEALTPSRDCAAFNQAMMDLGALLCTRRDPGCGDCPVASGCRAYAAGMTAAYPAPRPARRMPVRNTAMLVVESDAGVLLERRPPAGIWGGLWSFPECDPQDDIELHCREHLGLRVREIERAPAFRHTFSHFHLDIEPVRLAVCGDGDRVMTGDGAVWYKTTSLPDRGLAAPVRRLLDEWSGGATP